MTLSFTIPGAPRTKKTSPRVFPGVRFPKVLPSEAHEAWFAEAMSYAPKIVSQLREAGAELPLQGPVEVTAVFYRENGVEGDLNGYMQALGDWLQAPKLRPRRNGAGIIADDSQIESWDGTRRAIDRTAPRIEVTIRELPEEQMRLEAAEGGR